MVLNDDCCGVGRVLVPSLRFGTFPGLFQARLHKAGRLVRTFPVAFWGPLGPFGLLGAFGGLWGPLGAFETLCMTAIKTTLEGI